MAKRSTEKESKPKRREPVVKRGEHTWKCPACGNKIVTYLALTAVPTCDSNRKHHLREMSEVSK